MRSPAPHPLPPRGSQVESSVVADISPQGIADCLQRAPRGAIANEICASFARTPRCAATVFTYAACITGDLPTGEGRTWRIVYGGQGWRTAADARRERRFV